MYSSVLALLLRSLRMDVRSRGAHLARLGLMVAIYLSVIQIQLTGAWVGAPGLSFFTSILWLNLTFVTLIGIGAFSSVITEEKEEDTLGLLQMAGVSPLALLMGKVGGRFFQALALLVVQYPFARLSITLGGVGIEQIRAAYISLTAYVVMLAGLGVLFSTISRTGRAAGRLMVLALILYGLIPWACGMQVAKLAANGATTIFLPLLEVVSQASLYIQLGQILSTGYQSPLLNVVVVSNLLVGVACFLLAWALFGITSHSQHTEFVVRELPTSKAGLLRWFRPGRPTINPLVWKEFYFAVGGIPGLLVRAGFYIGLFTLLFVLLVAVGEEPEPSTVFNVFLVVQMLVLPIDASMLVSRSMQEEVRGQTIAALVMLPASVPSIVYAKLAGAMLGLIPGALCFMIALVSSGIFVRSEWFMGGVILFMVPYVLLLPHLTAVIALVARWGATPLAIGSLYVIQTVEGMLLLPIVLFFQNAPGEFYMTCLGLMNVALCIACHFEVMRRFRKLAEK
jgi:ABC-type transport system involved in multi-copper enzyme maturation permease subunit